MDTLTRLQDILIEDYPLKRETLTREAKLADLDIDSLGVMEMLFSIEDAFRLDVPHDKIELTTIGEVVDYIDRLIAEQHGTHEPDVMPPAIPPAGMQPTGGGRAA